MQPLTDQSPMPFGKHKGEKLEDVSGAYLLWCLRQDWIKGWKGLYDYLMERQDILLAEVDEKEKSYDRDEDEHEPFKSYQDFIDYSG